MNKEKVIAWLDDLIEQASQSDKYFKERIELYIENKHLLDLQKQMDKDYEELQVRVDGAIERLEALIVFWKKYNPIDNAMQIGQFEGVIEILKEGKDVKD